MRWPLPLLALTLALPCPAEADPPLVVVEARTSGGILVGGGAGSLAMRLAPITIEVLGAVATSSQPWTSVYGGLVLETLDRASVGACGGIRLQPASGPMRISAGLAATLAPYTLAGIGVAVGTCTRHGLCADLEGNAMLLGSDLPAERIVTQLRLVLGVSFHAL